MYPCRCPINWITLTVQDSTQMANFMKIKSCDRFQYKCPLHCEETWFSVRDYGEYEYDYDLHFLNRQFLRVQFSFSSTPSFSIVINLVKSKTTYLSTKIWRLTSFWAVGSLWVQQFLRETWQVKTLQQKIWPCTGVDLKMAAEKEKAPLLTSFYFCQIASNYLSYISVNEIERE